MGLHDRIKLLQAYLNEEPTDAFTLYALALEHSKLNHFRESEIYFNKLMDLHPNYLAAYYHFGKLYESHGNVTLAGNFYLKGMRIAERQGDNKTKTELQEAYNVLMNTDEGDF